MRPPNRPEKVLTRACGSGVVLAIVGPAILAVIQANPRRVQNTRDARAAVFTAVAATFMLTASGIFTTVAVYFSALGILYLVLAKQKWWRLRRIDALTSASILFIITIAWFVRNLVGAVRFEYEESLLLWLLDIVDIAISLLAAGIVGLAIYVTTKLKERSHLGVGNVSKAAPSFVPLWPIEKLTNHCRRYLVCCLPHPSSGFLVAHSSWSFTSRAPSPTGLTLSNKSRKSYIQSWISGFLPSSSALSLLSSGSQCGLTPRRSQTRGRSSKSNSNSRSRLCMSRSRYTSRFRRTAVNTAHRTNNIPIRIHTRIPSRIRDGQSFMCRNHFPLRCPRRRC